MKITSIMLAASLAALLSFSSCAKDPEPEPDNNNNPGTTASGYYLKFNGVTVKLTNPGAHRLKIYNGEDTTLEWYGNLPSADTGIQIFHIGKQAKKAINYTISTLPSNSNEVGITFKWSAIAGQPIVDIDKGTYRLVFENGIWVSELVDGEGVVRANSKRVTGIQMRVPWPK